jgi:FkbM family methyltransferase
MRTVERRVPWSTKTEWAWPDIDTQLLAVFDQVAAIDRIMTHVTAEDREGMCVQAGGACGVWPKRYAQEFARVLTFEPNPLCYECLVLNVTGTPNVVSFNYALGHQESVCRMAIPLHREHNIGAWYTSVGEGPIQVMPLDAWKYTNVRLIQLDVEGSEEAALMGAHDTIVRCQPLIVIEEKALFNAPVPGARALLENTHDYVVIDRIDRDLVMAPRARAAA